MEEGRGNEVLYLCLSLPRLVHLSFPPPLGTVDARSIITLPPSFPPFLPPYSFSLQTFLPLPHLLASSTSVLPLPSPPSSPSYLVPRPVTRSWPSFNVPPLHCAMCALSAAHNTTTTRDAGTRGSPLLASKTVLDPRGHAPYDTREARSGFSSLADSPSCSARGHH